jgi:class 3 adenylate cyclase
VDMQERRDPSVAMERSHQETPPIVRARTALTWGACLLTTIFVALDLLFYFLSDRGENAAHVVSELSVAGLVLTAAVGALVTMRRPGNRIGGLLLIVGLSLSMQEAAVTYVIYGLARHSAPPGLAWVAWVSNWAQSPGVTAILLVLLLYPTGRLPSPRWRLVAWAAVACGTLGLAGGLLEPVSVLPDGRTVADPTGLPAHGRISDVLGAGALLLVFLLLPGLAMAVVVRFRRAQGKERAQLKWLAYAAGVALVTLLIPTWWLGDWKQTVIDVVLAVGLPVAIGVAVLRHRLYDIDLLIKRTLVFGLLTAAVTVVYLVVVVGIGTLVGSRGKPNLFLSIVATALIAVAFQPARERSRRLANRLVYGKRATPYEVLSEYSRAMAGASTDDSLQRMARLLVEATGAVSATVWLRLGDMLEPQACWPQAGPLPAPITLHGRAAEQVLAVTAPGSRAFPVGDDEELLGALTVSVSPAEPLTVGSEKLIADLAAQTGLGLRFERMKERALFARALASFLPPEVAELVEASPSALSLREELEATILFSDIRGFSTLAEQLPPREVAEVVGRHLAAMVEVVTAHGGVLDKFAGDAVMAVFGAPRPADDHARRALGCAVAMQHRQAALNQQADKEGQSRFQIGIGINTGMVVAGTLGGAGRLDYTVLGDAVNVAQRLQSEALGGEILASATTVRQASTDRAEPVGLKHLKGRQGVVEVYRIRWADTSTAQPLDR